MYPRKKYKEGLCRVGDSTNFDRGSTIEDFIDIKVRFRKRI